MKDSLQLKLERLIERQEELEGLLSDPDVISNQNKSFVNCRKNTQKLNQLLFVLTIILIQTKTSKTPEKC